MAENQPNGVADAVAFLTGEAAIPETTEEAAVTTDEQAEGIGTSPSEPVVKDTVLEPVKDSVLKEPPKVEEKLSPQMEALARKERRFRDEQNAFKAERETFAKERETWAAERAAVEQYERLARTDLVGLAEKVKLDPAERQRLAIELWNSAQPEDKQAPVYREQAKVRTQAQELADRLAKLEAENKAHQERARMAEQRAKQAEFSEQIASSVEGLVSDKTPYLAALLKHDRGGVKEDLYNLVAAAYHEDPDTEITPAMLVERYEPLLAAKYEPLKRVFGIQPPKTSPPPEAESKKPPTTLSANRVATPTQARTEAKTEEELIADAAAWLESR